LPALEKGFQGKIEEIAVSASQDADTADDLSLGSTGLIFQEEIMLEEREIRRDGEISLAQMDEDGDLKN
jgi:hypothetical protein